MTAEKSWDPLDFSNQQADVEQLASSKKKQIRNILKSYVSPFDPFSELIQNAMDAVDRRKSDLCEIEYQPKLWLTINLKENSFSITDNGIGFKEKEFKSFLAPNISFKDKKKTRGNKGVGSTYIAYGFNLLQFGTKGNGHSFVGEISNGQEWVEDDQGINTRPVVVECKEFDPYFDEIDRGSAFKIKFGGKNTKPKDLTWFSAKTPEQWLYLLLIKTPLGSIPYLNNHQEFIQFTLKVIDEYGNEQILQDQKAVYMFPHTKISASKNLKDVLDAQDKLNSRSADASELPKKFFNSYGIYEFFTTQDLISAVRNLDEPELELLNEYKIEAYGYFAYSTSVWDQLNDRTAKLRKGYRILKGGLQLSTNQMPQGDLIVIPLTSNTGYQNQCHVIVHFCGADPDLGRKGFQPELKELSEKVAIGIVNRFKKWRRLLKSDGGTKPDITKEKELYEWVKQQEEHEKSFPLTIVNNNFFAPIQEISITSVPQSEQDVIVLFNQLIAGGVIRGIKLLATSQAKQYDGIFKFFVKEPYDNHIFDKDKNPLGVDQLEIKSDYISPPKVLEYKFNMDALMAEFENEEKNEKDISLVVTWDIGENFRKYYDVTSFLDLDNLHHRKNHGITHKFDSKTTSFEAIILSELVNYLNDIDGTQDFQKKKYGDDFL